MTAVQLQPWSLNDMHVRPVTIDDLETAVEFFNICSIDQIGVPEFKLDDIRHEWHAPGFNLATDIRTVWTPEGQLVGYIEVWDVEPHVRIHAWGRVHPAFHQRGIGSSLLDFAEQRARQAIANAPADVRVTLSQSALSTDDSACCLLEQHNWTLVRHFWRMVIDLDAPPPAPVLPAGIIIRPYDAEREFTAVVTAVRDSFKDHWGYVETSFEEDLERWRHWSQEDDFDPALWFVAIDGAEIAGVALCSRQIGEDSQMGWVNTLGVRRPWRRQGVALALLQHAFGACYQRGKLRVGLGVDATSLTGATRLYEKAGMSVRRQYDAYEIELRSGREISTQAM